MSTALYPATEKQMGLIRRLARDAGMRPTELTDLIRRVTADRARTVMDLDRHDASTVIDRLKWPDPWARIETKGQTV